MGLLIDLYSKKFINEAEIDGQPADDPNTTPTDYTDEGNPENQQQEENNNPPQNEEENDYDDSGEYRENDNNEPDNRETTDYTEMDDQEGQDQGQQGDNGQNNEDDNKDQPVDDLKSKEEELYSNLTPEQLDIKHKELKNRYLDMFDITSEIIDRINDAAISEETIGVIKYISETLSELRDMLSDYVNSIYQTKSYIENSINYNRFLAVLNGINKILEEIPKKED